MSKLRSLELTPLTGLKLTEAVELDLRETLESDPAFPFDWLNFCFDRKPSFILLGPFEQVGF